MASQLPHVLRGGLRETYFGVLSEDLPEDLARNLARFLEAQPMAGQSASAPPPKVRSV
jgi:hypothetical protein